MSYKVYKHTCPNGKSYIGITGQDEKKRWNYGNGYCTQLFGRAIKKYGWENIKHEILEVCENVDDAYESEIKNIAKYDTANPQYGYNCDKGGSGATGHTVGETARKTISSKNKERWADTTYRERMVAHLREVSDSNIGRKRGEDAIKKTIAATSKSVDQYTIDGEFVATYSSAMDAARSVGANSNSAVVGCCKGKSVTAHGFIWKYHGEPFDPDDYTKRVSAWRESAMTVATKNAEAKKIAVAQEDNAGNLIATYASAVDAQKATGINRNSIRRCCKGFLKHAGGYVWKNMDD